VIAGRGSRTGLVATPGRVVALLEFGSGTIRVGIVGCGRISGLHALGYRGREDARIEAVCDTKRTRAREKARAWGVEKVYADYLELLADPEIDLVELLVPHPLHA